MSARKSTQSFTEGRGTARIRRTANCHGNSPHNGASPAGRVCTGAGGLRPRAVAGRIRGVLITPGNAVLDVRLLEVPLKLLFGVLPPSTLRPQLLLSQHFVAVTVPGVLTVAPDPPQRGLIRIIEIHAGMISRPESRKQGLRAGVRRMSPHMPLRLMVTSVGVRRRASVRDFHLESTSALQDPGAQIHVQNRLDALLRGHRGIDAPLF